MIKLSEYDIQRTFHNWCEKQPYILEHWHVPNGMHSSPKECAKMKKIGLHSGVCDYWVLLSTGIIVAIEFKTSVGIASQQQMKFIHNLQKCNIPVEICRDTYTAVQFVKKIYKKSLTL